MSILIKTIYECSDGKSFDTMEVAQWYDEFVDRGKNIMAQLAEVDWTTMDKFQFSHSISMVRKVREEFLNLFKEMIPDFAWKAERCRNEGYPLSSLRRVILDYGYLILLDMLNRLSKIGRNGVEYPYIDILNRYTEPL